MSAKPEAGQRTETLPAESIVFVVGISVVGVVVVVAIP
jgi:hypothetical protein